MKKLIRIAFLIPIIIASPIMWLFAFAMADIKTANKYIKETFIEVYNGYD